MKGIGVDVGRGVSVGAGVKVGRGVAVAVSVGTAVGVNEGPRTCPGAQLERTMLKMMRIRTIVALLPFIVSPALSRANPAAAEVSRITLEESLLRLIYSMSGYRGSR